MELKTNISPSSVCIPAIAIQSRVDNVLPINQNLWGWVTLGKVLFTSENHRSKVPWPHPLAQAGVKYSMANVLSQVFNFFSSNRVVPSYASSEPDLVPLEAVLIPTSTAALQPLKNWSHPFKDKKDPLLQLTQLAKATAGYYPLGRNGLWHGGVHFDSGTAGTLDQSSVHCLGDGEVVAYRIDEHSPTTTYFVDELCVAKPFSRNFVLVRHHLQPPKIEGSQDAPPSLTFYSLYMHLQDWAVYHSDPAIARPAFWPEGQTRRVKATVTDILPGHPGQPGLRVRNLALRGEVLALLPRGAEVSVSGEGDYRKLENTNGPDGLKNADGSLRGYLSFDQLILIAGDEYRVKGSSLHVREEASVSSASITKLPQGTEVTVSGEGEFRKLERVNQYVHFNSMEGAREPMADRIVVLDQPIAIKAGDLIGHMGPYQDGGAEHPEKKLHLEVFSGDDVGLFIEASRAWADRLPATGKTWLKLAKGTTVVTHQASFNATQPPTLNAANTPSDADLWVPKSLLNSLRAEDKIVIPATADRKAYNWYHLDGLLHDANNTLLDGWVREEVGVTPWVNPWSWQGYGIIHNYDAPRQYLASFFRAVGRFSEGEVERHGALADKADNGAMMRRLYDIIDRDHNSVMTAEELKAAIGLPAHAQALSQLIIYYDSEWQYTPSKWDALDEVLGHSGSTPLLNWVAEKERIKQISWWNEIAPKVGLPVLGGVYHFHPVELVGLFAYIGPGSKILAGEITFNAEGNDISSSMYYSKVIHWPGNDLSGVTLGRGYDMGSRTQSEIYAHMTQAGIENEQARKISLAHGLKGVDARDFVRNNKALIGEITGDQQIRLFNIVYPDYISRAIFIYNKWTASEVGRLEWASLDQAIRDVLVDFVYQGFTAGPNPMKSGMHNSRPEMISYIESTPAINQYEQGRKRADYLRKY